jgi:hypothetical protein
MQKECKQKNTSHPILKYLQRILKEMHFPQASHYARRTLMVFSLYILDAARSESERQSLWWNGRRRITLPLADYLRWSAPEKRNKPSDCVVAAAVTARCVDFCCTAWLSWKKYAEKSVMHGGISGIAARTVDVFLNAESESETAEWFSQACIRKSKSEWMLRELLPLPGFCTRRSH